MNKVRQPSVAGSFYPSDPSRLRDDVTQLLESAAPATSASVSPQRQALIAPHAGYVYSGPIAASAFAALTSPEDSVRRVVVVGPSHFVPFRGVAVPSVGAFDTPLGEIALNAEGIEQIQQFDAAVTWDEPHRREHAIEVELPFLQALLGDFELVPLVTGAVEPTVIAKMLEVLWDAHTLVVVSSDLSHFYDYETARRLDAETARAIVSRRPEELGEGSACGRLAIQGLLVASGDAAAVVELRDLRNSGDTAGERDEVVGYGAFRLTREAADRR